MGCDIHILPEKQEPFGWMFVYRYKPEAWTRKDSYPTPDRCNYFSFSGRWYWLFGQLAGVRRVGPPIVEPRGLPKDASYDVRSFFESDEVYHTISWLTLEELKLHNWRDRLLEAESDDDIEESMGIISGWIDRLSEIDPDPKKVRIVFGFDN